MPQDIAISLIVTKVSSSINFLLFNTAILEQDFAIYILDVDA